MRVLVLALSVAVVLASSCGSNCLEYGSSHASTSCTTCPCGSSQLVVNVTQFTSLYTDWHGPCLDCIARNWNKGNAHAVGFEPTSNIWAIGLFRLQQRLCPQSDLCNPKTAVGCAHSVWQASGWVQWGVDIGYFGCDCYCQGGSTISDCSNEE